MLRKMLAFLAVRSLNFLRGWTHPYPASPVIYAGVHLNVSLQSVATDPSSQGKDLRSYPPEFFDPLDR